MDLFEILFIMVFILLPILEQVRKKGRRKGGKPGPGQPGPGSGPTRAEPRQPTEEPTAASDMVPDDLWSILTGESRPQGEEPVAVEREEPWSEVPEPSRSPAPASRRWDSEIETEPWEKKPEMDVWDVTAPDEPDPAPASLQDQGPPAYSQERVDYRPAPIERTVPTAEARHRAFHDLIERTRPVRRRRSNPVGRALRDPDQLRNAIILAEVLGPPKGLD